MTLDFLNSLISVGMAINLVYALFDNVQKKLSMFFDCSFKHAITKVEDTIKEYENARNGLDRQRIRINDIQHSFTIKSEQCTRLTKIAAVISTIIQFIQLFIASLSKVECSEWCPAMAWIDLGIIISPLIICVLGNAIMAWWYKRGISKVENKIAHFREVSEGQNTVF
jgi:hypothetical protein